MERTDEAGRWTSDDDGATWVLTDPSPGWLPQDGAVPQPTTTDDRLATLLEKLATANSLAKVREAAAEAAGA